MKVLLVKDVVRVGKRGDVLEVKDGFGRNFLIRQGLARVADVSAIRDARERVVSQQKKHDAKINAYRDSQAQLAEIHLVFHRKANDKGHLFAGIHQGDIAKALHSKGFDFIEERMVHWRLLKTVGEHTGEIALGGSNVLIHVTIEASL